MTERQTERTCSYTPEKLKRLQLNKSESSRERSSAEGNSGGHNPHMAMKPRWSSELF